MKLWLVGGLSAVVVAGGAAAAYCVHYSGRALPGATVAGQSVSGMDRDQVADMIEQRAQAATLTLDIDGQTHEAGLADLGYSVDADSALDQVFAPNAEWTSRLTGLMDAPEVALAATAADDTLTRYIDGLAQGVGDVGRNASVTVNPETHAFEVAPSQPGRTLDAQAIRDAAAEVAQTLEPVSRTVEIQDQQPTFVTEQAQPIADAANALIAPEITLKGGTTRVTAGQDVKASWVSVPVVDDVAQAPALDAAKIAEWVRQQGEATNEPATDGVRNVNSRGEVVSEYQAGSAGYQFNNPEPLSQGIVEALTQGQPYVGQFEYDRTPEPQWEERLIADGAEGLAYAAAPGEKWIDLNLSSNTVSAYEGSTIVQGPIPMVPGDPRTPTPTGQFQVLRKVANDTMRGEDFDGTQYVTEDVPWATYFTNAGHAFHGAPWRSSFGWSGTGGSHGCVNMPVDGASWIYSWAPIGTKVVSHY